MTTSSRWLLGVIVVSGGCSFVSGLDEFEIVKPDGAGGMSSTSGGGMSSSSGGSGFSTIGGAVSGLVGKGLIVKNNGTDDLQLLKNGPFSFPAKLPAGSAYDVTVSSNPTSPSQVCSVINGAGTSTGQDVTDVQIDCKTQAFAIGGSVVGLSGNGLVLTNNGGGDLPVNVNGAFQFAQPVLSGASYSVAIKTQPSVGGPCTVSGGTGTVGNADVGSIIVNCAAGTYTVGGMVTGLVGSIVIQQNGGSDLTLTADGGFAFAQTLPPGASYNVTIVTQPSYPPRAQQCTVMNANGTMGAANVTNVAIVCTTKAYSIGGTAAGLMGTLGLANNGGDMLSVPQSGAFSFAMPVQSGDAYSVSVVTAPPGQTCNIINGSGTVASAAIADVLVACVAATGNPGILCGNAYCDPAASLCCNKGGTLNCATKCTGAAAKSFKCDSASDCAVGNICCGTLVGGVVTSTSCTPDGQCSAPNELFCNPNDPSPCPNGGTCTPTNDPPGYFRCL